jgi:hypothetical protein
LKTRAFRLSAIACAATLCAAHAAAADPKTPPVETDLAAGLAKVRSCLKREADDGDRT